MRTTESKTTSRLIVAGAVVAAVLALALALWGCAPNATGATTDQKGDNKATEETTTSASVYPNFTEKGRRLVPRHVLQPRYAQHRQPRLQCVSREPIRQNGEQGGPDPTSSATLATRRTAPTRIASHAIRAI